MLMPKLPDFSTTSSGPAQGEGFSSAPFMYVKVPIPKRAFYDMARDEAIDHLLRDKGLGAVIGWGDSLGERLPDGSRPAAFHRIDIEVSDLDLARALLHQAIPALDLPSGTEIHYRRGPRPLHDIYASSGWQLEQPDA